MAKRNGDGWVTYSYDVRDTSFQLSRLEEGLEYTFLVQAYANGSWTPIVEKSTVRMTYVSPDSPHNVSVTPAGPGELRVSWEPVEGASSYAVAELMPDGSWRPLDNAVPAGSTSYEVSGLWPGREHSFLVQARVDGSWSVASKRLVVGATPAGAEKPEPRATLSGSSCELSWDAVPGAERYAVAIQCGEVWKTYTYDLKNVTYLISALEPGQTYRFVVQAYVEGQWSSFSSEDILQYTMPGTSSDIPRPIFETRYHDGKIYIYWSPLEGISEYAIAWSRPGEGLKTRATTSGNRFILSGLKGGNSYQILVQAKKDANYSKYSSADIETKVALDNKVGWQNPWWMPQVSSANVVLPSYAQGHGKFSYVSPSEIYSDSSRAEVIEAFLGRARRYIGTQFIEPYSTADAVDCSGLVLQCLYAVGIDMEHARGTEKVGGYNPWNHYTIPEQTYNSMRWYENDTFQPISLGALEAGDLVFYHGHVAIYVGGGQIIDSCCPRIGVTQRSMYAAGTPIGAQRIFIK